ncbi:MAG: hypothetical protein ACLUD1_03200 [Clostridia bacterium]
MKTIWKYETTEDTDIEMKYILNSLTGKCKVVLISSDNTVNIIFENADNSQNTDYSTTTLHIKSDLNRIKVVADRNTKIEFDFVIDDGKFIEL